MDRRPKADRPFAALRRHIERLAREAPAGETRVNLSTRLNRSVVVNSGQSGSRQAAVSRQTSPIRQDGKDTVDAAETSATLAAEGGPMADQEQDQYKKLSREELNELAGSELPERAAMSLINANIAIPVNAAIAANVLSDGAIAYANATQDTPIDQGN